MNTYTKYSQKHIFNKINKSNCLGKKGKNTLGVEQIAHRVYVLQWSNADLAAPEQGQLFKKENHIKPKIFPN